MTASELAPLLKAQILFATFWPIAVAVAMLLMLRGRIARRGAFFVVSSLASYGIAPLVGLIVMRLPLPTIEQIATPDGTLRQAFLTSLWVTAIVSVALSIPFNVWLSQFFRERVGA